jgi:site-specific DNA-methyltransferase (adenine-specific)
MHKLMDADPKSPLQEGHTSAFHAAPCSPLLDSILCADNCEALAAMQPESVDLVVTSPPYDDLRTYGGHSWDFYGVAWLLKRVLKPGGVIVWNVADATKDGSESGTSMRQALHFQSLGMNLHDTMIYASDKPPLTHNRYEQAWEYMFVLTKGKPKAWNPLMRQSTNPGGKSGKFIHTASAGYAQANGTKPTAEKVVERNIWSYATGQEKSGHPAPFPDQLAKDHVASWSNPGDVVLDPFAGSGTTLKAAKELNRRFIGIEINPEYVAICQRRIAQDVLPLFSENVQADLPATVDSASRKDVIAG